MKKLIGLIALAMIVSLAGCTQANQTEETTTTETETPTEKVTTLQKTGEEGNHVYYEGKITLSGNYFENYPGTLLGGTLCFRADEETGYLIPRDPNLYGEGKADKRNPWFCFQDQYGAKNAFGIDDEEIFADSAVTRIQGTAKIEVSNYVVDKMESSVYDTALLENIISKEPFEKEYN